MPKQVSFDDSGKIKLETIVTRHTDLPIYPINNFRTKSIGAPVCLHMAVADQMVQEGSKMPDLELHQEKVSSILAGEMPCPTQDTCEKFQAAKMRPHQLKLGDTT